MSALGQNAKNSTSAALVRCGLADLRRFGPAPARADLPDVTVFPFLLAEVEGGNAGRVLYEPNDGEFLTLDRLDLLPSLNPLRPVRRINPLGDYGLVVELAGRLEQRLTITSMVLAVEDRCYQFVLFYQLLQQLLAGKLRKSAEVYGVQPQEIEGEVNQPVLVASAEVRLRVSAEAQLDRRVCSARLRP
ncbi:hypothetical protein ABIC03_006624 [Bradyrhizobium sp. RT6a]